MTGTSQQPRPSLDTLLDVLSNRFRRRLLVALLEHNPQSDRDTHIPNDGPHDENEVDVLTLQVVHVHLPKLDAAGFVEWNRRANSISKGPRFEEIRPLLELMRDHADELPDDWI
ncbi:ArsR family transcriptional regulator [Haloferax namakaokahaiae]|uniref:ArsR family transcriptional regulator n=1 Tax=Haloferax namakaokahaiae TaxID=1748331 RepID=A0ABD5ZFL2_9EURY